MSESDENPCVIMVDDEEIILSHGLTILEEVITFFSLCLPISNS